MAVLSRFGVSLDHRLSGSTRKRGEPGAAITEGSGTSGLARLGGKWSSPSALVHRSRLSCAVASTRFSSATAVEVEAPSEDDTTFVVGMEVVGATPTAGSGGGGVDTIAVGVG